MEAFEAVFSDPAINQFFGDSGLNTTIKAPVIMIIPIAIYI